MIRRVLDIVASSTALLLSAPVLALAALAIRLETPGPVIYRQRRIGLHGRSFDALKLRTMVQGAEGMGRVAPKDERQPDEWRPCAKCPDPMDCGSWRTCANWLDDDAALAAAAASAAAVTVFR